MIAIGSYVQVPQTPGNISRLCNTGYVTAIIQPHCKVLIRYGKNMKGYWEGPIQHVQELERPTEEKYTMQNPRINLRISPEQNMFPEDLPARKRKR